MFVAIKAELNEIEISRTKLRHFGYVVGGIFSAIGLVGVFVGFWRAAAPYLGFFGVALVLFGALHPKALRRIYQVWMGFAVVVGYVVGRILLSALYIVVVTPVAVAARLFGHGRLALDFDKSVDTYWAEHDQESDRSIEYPY